MKRQPENHGLFVGRLGRIAIVCRFLLPIAGDGFDFSADVNQQEKHGKRNHHGLEIIAVFFVVG